MAGILPCSITGYSILRFSDNVNAKYGAVFLNAIACFGASSGFLSWGINNAGSPAVAAVAGGYMVMIGSIGGVLSTLVTLMLSQMSEFVLTPIQLDLFVKRLASLPQWTYYQPCVAVFLLLLGLLWARPLRIR